MDNLRRTKKSRTAGTIAIILMVAQVAGSLAAGVAITPTGLYDCINQGKTVDWVGGRCSYVFLGTMIDASYPILTKDERTAQDGKDIVQLGIYTVKTPEGGEGTIKTRNNKITENTVDSGLVGRELDILSGEGQVAQVKQYRSLTGPLGGTSPTKGFCYNGKLYKAHTAGRSTLWEAESQGACPAEDDSITRMDNR